MFVQCEYFSDKEQESFRCGRPHFLMQKNPYLLKFMVCLHGQGERGELSQCGHFSDKRVGFIFHDFVRTSFMDGPFHEKKNLTLLKLILLRQGSPELYLS